MGLTHKTETMKSIKEQLTDLKQKSHTAYIETYIDLIKSFDLSGIELQDWQNVVLQEVLTEQKNNLWLPKAVNLNKQKYFERLFDNKSL